MSNVFASLSCSLLVRIINPADLCGLIVLDGVKLPQLKVQTLSQPVLFLLKQYHTLTQPPCFHSRAEWG